MSPAHLKWVNFYRRATPGQRRLLYQWLVTAAELGEALQAQDPQWWRGDWVPPTVWHEYQQAIGILYALRDELNE